MYNSIVVNNAIPLNNIYEISEELKKYLSFLVIYFGNILKNPDEFEEKVKQIESRTSQNLNRKLFVSNFWILRFSFPFIWFCDIKIPDSQDAFGDNMVTYMHALKIALARNSRQNWLPWITKGFDNYINSDKGSFTNFDQLNESFTERVGVNIPRLVFDCTEVRLGGNLHDSLTELLMTTIMEDQKAFNMEGIKKLTSQERDDIKKIIEDMKPTQEDFNDFIKSISVEN